MVTDSNLKLSFAIIEKTCGEFKGLTRSQMLVA